MYQFLFYIPRKKVFMAFTIQFSIMRRVKEIRGTSAWPSQYVTKLGCLYTTSISPGSRNC